MKNQIPNRIKRIYYFIVVLILVSALFFEVFVVTIMKNQVTKIEKEIAHLDEEIDEMNSGIKRLLNRDNFYESLKNNEGEKLPRVKIDNTEHDFGIVEKKKGVIDVTFNIVNEGEGELIMGDIVTSCGCTSAKISNDKITPGNSAILTVYFDPSFHEEPLGRISRSIFVPTNDPENKELEFKIFVEIKN